MRAELVAQARDGDHAAFTRLVEADGSRCYAIAYRILRDVDRAQDAVQQTFLGVWQDLPRLRDPDRYEVWLHRILVNACYREAHRTRRWQATIRPLPMDGPGGPDTTRRVDDVDEIEQLFNRLSTEHRTVVVLHHYVGLPLTDIAEITGVPVGTVKSRMHNAMRNLRVVVGTDGGLDVQEARPA
jgi:RNA polymerase sigma-70 factor (ECF subfamily)